MKRSRIRNYKLPDKPNNTEWFLKMYIGKKLKYNGWYNPTELLNLKECSLTRPALMIRLDSSSKAFNTVEKCLTVTKFSPLSYEDRNSAIKEKIAAKHKNKAYLIKDLTYTLMTLWPIGSMYKQARILNSK